MLKRITWTWIDELLFQKDNVYKWICVLIFKKNIYTLKSGDHGVETGIVVVKQKK